MFVVLTLKAPEVKQSDAHLSVLFHKKHRLTRFNGVTFPQKRKQPPESPGLPKSVPSHRDSLEKTIKVA